MLCYHCQIQQSMSTTSLQVPSYVLLAALYSLKELLVEICRANLLLEMSSQKSPFPQCLQNTWQWLGSWYAVIAAYYANQNHLFANLFSPILFVISTCCLLTYIWGVFETPVKQKIPIVLDGALGLKLLLTGILKTYISCILSCTAELSSLKGASKFVTLVNEQYRCLTPFSWSGQLLNAVL